MDNNILIILYITIRIDGNYIVILYVNKWVWNYQIFIMKLKAVVIGMEIYHNMLNNINNK